MDPITALSAASAAFGAVKRLVETGREIEDVAGQLGKWFSAVSDINEAERQAKKPPLFKKLLHSGSVEEEALNVTIAQQKIKEQERDLRELVVWRFGLDVYRDMMKMRAKIRERREREIYRQKRLRANALEYLAIGGLLLMTFGTLFWFVNLIISRGG